MTIKRGDIVRQRDNATAPWMRVIAVTEKYDNSLCSEIGTDGLETDMEPGHHSATWYPNGMLEVMPPSHPPVFDDESFDAFVTQVEAIWKKQQERWGLEHDMQHEPFERLGLITEYAAQEKWYDVAAMCVSFQAAKAVKEKKQEQPPRQMGTFTVAAISLWGDGKQNTRMQIVDVTRDWITIVRDDAKSIAQISPGGWVCLNAADEVMNMYDRAIHELATGIRDEELD